MRPPFARLARGLLPALAAVGCHREPAWPEAPASAVAGPRPAGLAAEDRATAHPPPRRRWDDPEPLVVRARYGVEKGACVIDSDGAIAMPAVDTFTITEMIRGEPRATDISVRPGYPVDTAYPRGLAFGQVVTLRVKPPRDEWERLAKARGEAHRRLHVDPEDVERIETPIPPQR